MSASPADWLVDSAAYAEELAALDSACFAPAWSAQEYRAWQRQPTFRALLARGPLGGPEARPLGLLGYSMVGESAEIYRLGVHPDARRRGVARQLLAALESALREAAPHGRIWLEVRAENAAAIALYRAAGYAEAGRRKAYYAAPVEDALLMERRLT